MIHVATATDGDYLPWCATMIRSCLDHHGESLAVYVLHERVPEDDLDPLVAMVRAEGATIRLISDPPEIQDLPVYSPFGGRTHLLRLVLPDLLPDLSRVVYLDADTLVAAPLDDLWATALDGHPLAAVRNVVEPQMRQHVRALTGDHESFFNGGVLLIDMDAVREDGSFDRILASISTIAPSAWSPDQDALNVEFAARWKPLHPRWNAMNSLWTWSDWATELFGSSVVREATEHPAIVHFEGPALCKPWHYLCEHPWLEQYRATLARTPWKSEPLLERSLGTRVISHLPRRSRVRAYWLWRRYRAKIEAAGVSRSL